MKYLGFKFVHEQHEDCIVSWAEFTFDDEGVEMIGESPRYDSNFEDYHCLIPDTLRVSKELANGGEFEQLCSEIYRASYSHVED